MNIMQAVIAFSKALDMDNSSDEILDVMKRSFELTMASSSMPRWWNW